MKQPKLRKQVCYLFTAANGNSLFLPAAGYRDEYYLYHAGSSGFYWSSSLYTHDPYEAWDGNPEIEDSTESMGDPMRGGWC